MLKTNVTFLEGCVSSTSTHLVAPGWNCLCKKKELWPIIFVSANIAAMLSKPSFGVAFILEFCVEHFALQQISLEISICWISLKSMLSFKFIIDYSAKYFKAFCILNISLFSVRKIEQGLQNRFRVPWHLMLKLKF